MGRPLKSEARDTRREILSAALGLFADQGFHGTSMRQIARKVGVRESALYHHFQNKQELFTAMINDLGPATAEQIAHQLDIDVLLRDGPQQYLRALVHRVLEWWATPEQQQFARLLITEGFRGKSPRVVQPEQVVGQVLGMFLELFGELLRRELIRPVDPEILVHEWMGPILIIRLRFFLTTDKPDLKRAKALADKHVAFFCQAVRR